MTLSIQTPLIMQHNIIILRVSLAHSHSHTGLRKLSGSNQIPYPSPTESLTYKYTIWNTYGLKKHLLPSKLFLLPLIQKHIYTNTFSFPSFYSFILHTTATQSLPTSFIFLYVWHRIA